MAYKPKEKILTAGEVCKWWGITKEQLDKLRWDWDLPFVELSKGVYVFRESTLTEWIKNKEVVHNKQHR